MTNFSLQLQSIKLRISVVSLNLFLPLSLLAGARATNLPKGDHGFFGENIPPQEDLRGLASLPIHTPPTKHPRLLPARIDKRKADTLTRPIARATPISFPNPPRKDTKDLLIDLRRVEGCLKRFSDRWTFSRLARSVTKNGLGGHGRNARPSYLR